MSLLIVGVSAFDTIETPFGRVDRILGGPAVYASIAASFLYDKVKLLSVVGGDFGSNIEVLKDRGINVDGVEVIEKEKSFFWSARYNNDMNSRETLVTNLNVLEKFDPKIPPSYKDIEYVMLGNLTPKIQQQTLNRLIKRPKLVVLDTMNYWIDEAPEDLMNVLKSVDVLTINDAEARQLSGEYSLVKAASKLQTFGPRYVIIKKGEHGSLLFGDNQVFSAPALPLADVFDPTGAGDSFAGGFIGYLAKVNTVNFTNIKNAVVYGSVLASFCVESFGVERLLTLSTSAISNRIKAFVKLSRFDLDYQF